MIADPPVIARLRAELAEQVTAPLEVSPTSHQHYFDESSAAYNDIEVRQGEAFAVVVVRGALPSEEFVVRVWHRYADEVWLVDSSEQVVFVVPRTGVIRVFEIGDTLYSRRLPGVHIAVSTVFGIFNSRRAPSHERRATSAERSSPDGGVHRELSSTTARTCAACTGLTRWASKPAS